MGAANEIYLSFFMFTADLRPHDRSYTEVLIGHIRKLREQGYAGFDLPIAPSDGSDLEGEVASYRALRHAFDRAGLEEVQFTTNVFATRSFDPSSPYAEQRAAALGFLKSRVDITAALRGRIMAGPILIPYGMFPTTDTGQALWSDALQDWATPRYRAAAPVLHALGEHAERVGVKLAIEPVDHWETPAPNMVSEVVAFLRHVPGTQVGVCIDSAHVVLGGDGPAAFTQSVEQALAAGRLHSVHVSAPDRGAVHESWIPWQDFLRPILAGYRGPLLIEVFNAVPVFAAGLRLSRRKFWIPGEDAPTPGVPSAYEIAEAAIGTLRAALPAG